MRNTSRATRASHWLVLCAFAWGEGAQAANITLIEQGAQTNIVSSEQASAASQTGVARAASLASETHDTAALPDARHAAQGNVIARPLPAALAELEAASAAKAASATNAANATRTATAAPKAPDERPLWNLLHANRLADFDALLASFTQRFPSWKPSASLTEEEARQRSEAQLKSALTGDLPALRRLVATEPDAFGCAHIDRAWRAADRFAAAGDAATVYALYRPIIPGCASDVNRVVTLQRAVQQLPPGEADALIALEADRGRRGAASDRTFAQLRSDRVLGAAASWSSDPLRVAGAIGDVGPSIRASHDTGAATRAGWLAFEVHDYDASARWFQQAIGWAHDASTKDAVARVADATLGLVQVRIAQRDIDTAERLLAVPGLASDPRARPLRAEIALLRAADAYRRGKFGESLAALDVAEANGAPAERIDTMRGWNLFSLGRYADAARVFDAHYRAHRDDDSAEGLALSAMAQGRARVAARDDAQPGPLSAYTAALDTQRLYYQKQFVAARAEWRQASSGGADAQRIAHYLPADLTGIDAPSITGGLAWSNHAGDTQQGRLTMYAPSVDAEWFGAQRVCEMRYRQLFLSAGNGNVSAEELQGKISQTVRVGDMQRLNLAISGGVTTGGAIGPRLEGEASVGQQLSNVAWTGYVSHAPVRESLLSWRGMTGQSPQASGTWGGVARTMTGGAVRVAFAPRWNLSAGGHADWLNGLNVDSNSGGGADLAVSYDFRVPGFDYFSAGPAVHYLGYRRNENFYLPPNGGYYSPQRSVSGGVGLQMLTKEGRSWQVSGSLETGYNSTYQASGDCPVQSGVSNGVVISSSCEGSRDHGPYAHLQLAAVLRLAQRWQIGALTDVNVTPGRDRQIAALAFVRYFLAPRGAVFSRDLPQSTRDFRVAFDDSR